MSVKDAKSKGGNIGRGWAGWMCQVLEGHESEGKEVGKGAKRWMGGQLRQASTSLKF